TGSTILFLIVCATTKVLRPPHDCHYVTLWKALVLASFCKFLLVPGLIWGEMGPVTHHYFVTGYTLMSQLKAHSVVTHSSRLMSGLIVALGLVGKVASMQLLSQL
ncbi:unnamed protein product, partial [Timema podura]|nr:unnamed protein product [Timema podura]